jgi:phosphatidylinositol alpha-mannosyltransferase
MKVAITSATTWPYVRRGMERFVNELAASLAGVGHDVTVISSKAGRKQIVERDGFTTVCHRRLWHPALAKVGLLEFHMFFFPCVLHLLRERFDIVLSVAFMDAYAAQVARRFTKVPSVFVPNGIPHKVSYVRSLSLGGAVHGSAVRKADSLVLYSDYARQYFLNRWQRDSEIIPIGFDAAKFYPRPELKGGRPRIVCAAALQDRRKGGRLLMKAFDRLKERRPDVMLQVASPLPHALRDQLLPLVSPKWRQDVEFVTFNNRDAASRWDNYDLPRLVAGGTVSVLPSIWEPFGMVVIESMASGTPVVAARDGALPELIQDCRIGRLFDPGDDSHAEPTNVDGLVQALDEGIELGLNPDTATRCREFALQFSWEVVGRRFEEMLKRTAGITEPVGTTVGVS